MLTTQCAAQRKTLVFSQMTRMLDIIELALEDAHIDFVRLDGQV